MDGLDRRAMEHRQRHPAGRFRAGGWTRTPLERAAQSTERSVMDLAHGRTLAGPPAAIWLAFHRAPALPKLGEVRRDGKLVAHAGPTPPGCWRFGFEGMFCGRDICSGQKRGRQVGKTKRGKGTKIMGIADGAGLPLALRTESASPAEVKLLKATLEARVVAEVPERLIGDKAYDSDKLDDQLMQEYGTELIAPNKINRKAPTQDGRPLRRYRKRWKIERLFAWLFNFRRLVVRYEYHAEYFQGLVHLAAAVILLRYL